MSKTETENYIDWINKQDLFLVKDLLDAFNIERTECQSSKEKFISSFFKTLRDAGYIQASGKKSTGIRTVSVQYITVKFIPNDYLIRHKIEKSLIDIGYNQSEDNIRFLRVKLTETSTIGEVKWIINSHRANLKK